METLNIDGTVYKTNLTKKYKKSLERRAKSPDEICTVIPGKVVKLNVKNGDKVNHGDILMLFEAMKMQNIIYAPHNGIIDSLTIKEGDNLAKGVVMMKIIK